MASDQFSRLDKINQSLNRKISELIIHKCNDPRIGMLVINKVTVSPDLSRARIFFSPVDKNVKNVDGTLKGLDAAAGFLRSELAKDSSLRRVPKLKFIYDEKHEKSSGVRNMIDSLYPAGI
ncbi:MAG: 30S ribosome-binding factor RbfA [Francisellaceae bacterium]|nr:30S ribosome-binding factor RbfA [Francisellaceae bacterium]